MPNPEATLMLIDAFNDKNYDIAVQAIKQKAKIDVRVDPENHEEIIEDSGGDTLLYYSIMNDIPNKFIELLIQKKASPVSKNGYTKETPLHAAAYKGNMEVVKLLVESIQKRKKKTLDIWSKYKGQNYKLPLFLADKHPEIFKYLVEQGADIKEYINLRYSFGTSLSDIINSAHPEVTRFVNEYRRNILKEKFVVPFLFEIIYHKDSVEILRQLVKEGVDLEEEDEEGETVLFKALNDASFEVIETLVELGCNIHHKAENNTNALIQAVNRDLKFLDTDKVLRLLIDKGVDVNEAKIPFVFDDEDEKTDEPELNALNYLIKYKILSRYSWPDEPEERNTLRRAYNVLINAGLKPYTTPDTDLLELEPE